MTLPVAKTTMPSACLLWQNPSSLSLALQRAAERHHILSWQLWAIIPFFSPPSLEASAENQEDEGAWAENIDYFRWKWSVAGTLVSCISGRFFGKPIFTYPCFFHSPEAPVPSAPEFGGLILTPFSFFKGHVE